MFQVLCKMLFVALVFLGTSLKAEIQSVLLHPIFDQYYVCAEHWDGQFKDMGDALGTDCFIQKLSEVKDRSWLRSYKNDGSQNTDWYGWQQNVLAPLDGQVVKINENKSLNKPGLMGKGMSSWIVIQREDGLMVLLAHVDSLKVKLDDHVKAGQVIAVVGNNGQSRHPHIHIGAWKDKTPFQIRFDQTKMKGL